jgi:Ni/Co efflux regulator RcnB
MKSILCTFAAIALTIPAGVAAQRQSDRNQTNQTAQDKSRPNHQRPPTTKPAQPSRPNRSPATTKPAHPARPIDRPPTIQPVKPNPSRPSHPTRPPTTLPVYRPGHRPSTYHRVRGPIYNYPHGYAYRRWTVGRILPHIFLSNLYYWTNWAALGLGPAPPGYVWVRYGPDLLLVDRYTGRIADVIYGAFY